MSTRTRPKGRATDGPAQPGTHRHTPAGRSPPAGLKTLGFTGIAAASAIATAIIQPPTGATGTTTTITQDVAGQSAAPVRHVTQYVQLKPGQTAPPNATVKSVPQPTPRVVVMTTHQSGKP